MPVADRRTRAISFGSVARDYARYRPPPPREAAEWAIGDRRRVVIDLAAGTGNLTEHLMAMGTSLAVAVDLDVRMLEVLEHRVPTAVSAAAQGEDLPLRSASADAVAISSAWHWLDHDRAWPELARVIRPGGRLAVMWSGPDRRRPWVADVLGPPAEPRDRAEAGGRAAWTLHRMVEIPEGIPFGGVEERVFESSVRFAVADLPGLVASYSRVITLDAVARREVMETVVARASSHPELTQETVEMPLRCRVWRAERGPVE